MNARRWIITLAVAILAAGAGSAGTAWYLGRDDDQARALEYAREACKDQKPGETIDVSTVAPAQASTYAADWELMANNAARAARLDPVWNELSRGIDASARVWALVARGDQALSGQIDAGLQEIGQHPVDPECRKATVS